VDCASSSAGQPSAKDGEANNNSKTKVCVYLSNSLNVHD
jgi:hypothetical protein